MSNGSRYFKLGMFVIAGVVLIVGGVVLFGASALFTPYVTVQAATTDSVEGLNVGSAVKYNGVEVGSVSKIELASWSHSDPDPAVQQKIGRYIIVEMKLRRAMFRLGQAEVIEQRLKDSVTAGLRLRLASSGLTGPAFIEGVFLDPQAYPPQELPWKPDKLLIPSAPSTMSAIVSDVQDIAGKIDRIEINKLFASAQKFITDTDTAVNDLHTAELRQRAVAAIEKLNDTLNRINEIVRDPKTQQTLDDLNATLANTSEGSARLRRTLATLETLLASQSQDLKTIIYELSRASENASNLLNDLQQNPSRALFGQPPPHIEPGAKQK
jgi:ABC-type transporter Mla subunit MlaD